MAGTQDSTKEVPSDDQILTALDQLESAESQLEQLRKQLDEEREKNRQLLEEQAILLSGQRVTKGAPLKMPTGNYKFRVGPANPSKLKSTLPTIEIETVDESEAIRWYCANHEYPENSGRSVDPVHVQIACKCVDDRRARFITLQNKLGIVRAKVNSNQSLSPEEQKMLEEFPEQIYGIATGM